MNEKSLSIAKFVLMGLSGIALGVYLDVAFSRVAYPFAVEWVEANVFLQVVRVLEGKSLYVPPSWEFVPTIYPPFYYYVAAIFARATNQVMFAMRLVSLLASMWTFVMIYVLCRLRKITRELSIGAVGLYAASYAVTGYWFDVGRVDSLFIALALTGYVLAIIRTKRESIVGTLAGFVFFLAFATKQSALAAIPFALLYILLERRWMKALWLGISAGISCGLFFVSMNILSKGWFALYTSSIPSAHPVSWEMVIHNFWTLYIFPKFPWLLIIIILALCLLLGKQDKNTFFNYVIFIFTFFLPLAIMSVASMAKQWGYINGLIPIAAALSVLGAEAYQQITAPFATPPGSPRRWAFKSFYTAASIAASIMMLMQFNNLRYDFRTQIPSQASLEAGYRILDILRNSQGPVYIPAAPYLLYMVHQPTHFQMSSLGDISLAVQYDPRLKQVAEGYTSKISEYISSHSIRTAILPNSKRREKVFNSENGYRCESLIADHPPLITVTGATSYLDQICFLDDEQDHSTD